MDRLVRVGDRRTRVDRIFTAWYRLTSRVAVGLGVLAGACLAGLALLTTVDVVLRATLKSCILGRVELTEIAMLFVAPSWIAYTQAKKGHISVDLITGRMPGKARSAVNAVGALLGLSFAALVVWHTTVRIIDEWGQGRSSFMLHIPSEVPLAFISMGFLLYLLLALNIIFEAAGLGNLEDSTRG